MGRKKSEAPVTVDNNQAVTTTATPTTAENQAESVDHAVAATATTSETPTTTENQEKSAIQAIIEKKRAIRDEAAELVSKWNESAEYAEYKTMAKLEEEIAQKVTEYTELAWDETVLELKQTEKPMVEAAKRLTFETIKVKPEKQEDGTPVMIMYGADKPIDVLALHKAIEGGIGEDKKWHSMIEKLNFLITCRRAIELGLNTDEINKSYAMSQQATKMDMFLTGATTFDKNGADELLRKDMQLVVNAMIGDGYEVVNKMVSYLLMVYQKKNSKRALSIVCATHKHLRQYMLEVCNSCITGDDFEAVYKEKKKK